MKTLSIILCGVLQAGLMAMDQPKIAEHPTITLQGARRVIAAAEEYARQNGAPGGAIAVVDEGGNLVAVERLEGTFAAGAQVSIGKARTAALFKRPTSFFENLIRQGRTPMLALDDFTPLQGGVPITIAGRIVGAVGVSGAASAQQDEEMAMAGAAALSDEALSATQPEPISVFDAEEVKQAFAAGKPLLEQAGYKLHASRRVEPGLAEVHDDETDIFLVLEGNAVLVTGGQVVDAKVTEPGQVRGSGIEGGSTSHLKPGDAVVIPAGTPHQFTEVEGPFLYFVVKPIAAQ